MYGVYRSCYQRSSNQSSYVSHDLLGFHGSWLCKCWLACATVVLFLVSRDLLVQVRLVSNVPLLYHAFYTISTAGLPIGKP